MKRIVSVGEDHRHAIDDEALNLIVARLSESSGGAKRTKRIAWAKRVLFAAHRAGFDVVRRESGS